MIHHQEKLSLPVAVVIAGLCISASVYFGAREIAHSGPSASTAAGTASAQVAAKQTTAPVTAQDHIRGSMNAKVTLIEYSDLECPFCKQYHAAIKEAIAAYPAGTVAWVYRHFPLSIHPKAQKEAEAAECAAAQGGNEAFWKFIDGVFEVTPSNNGLDEAKLPAIAQSIGLNVAVFNACLQSGAQKAAVAADAQSGSIAGAAGTPFTAIVSKNGTTFVKGAISATALKQKIDEALDRHTVL